MKKILIAGILLLSTFIANAHWLEDGCTYHGRRSIKAMNLPLGLTLHVTTNTGFDSSFVNTQVNQSFTIPQTTTSVDITVIYSDGIINTLTTGVNLCSTLAINPVSVNYEVNNYGNTTVYIKITNEQNIRSLVVRDRKTKQIYTIIIPNGSGLYTVKLQ